MKILSLTAALAVLLVPIHSASAHTLVVDEQKSGGMVMHISPEDDPVAGQPAVVSLDFQSKEFESVEAVINGPNGVQEKVKFSIEGALAEATYTFPAVGTYEFVITATSGGESKTFREQRSVNRSPDQNNTISKKGMLIVVGVGLLSLMTLAALVTVLRRKK